MNIYQELGVETIINAAGSMTDLGGSIMDPETTNRRELPPGIGSLIPFVSVTWDEKMLGVTLQEVVRQLREGVPRIAIKLVDEQTPGVKHPQLWIRVHTLQEVEETVVARRIKELLSERRLL